MKPRRRPRVLVAGAFDRFNFGDLLFAHLAAVTLADAGLGDDEVDIVPCALRAADLRSVGGVDACSLAAAVAESDAVPTVLLVAGGEVLHARWTDAHSALASPPEAVAIKALHRLGPVAASWADTWSRRRLAGPGASQFQHRPLPWVFPSDHLPSTSGGTSGRSEITVTYAAVGGCRLDRLPPKLAGNARRGLAAAGHLSVRDSATADHLERWGLEANLAPDPAGRLEDLYPAHRLPALASPATTSWLQRQRRRYLVVQASRYLAWNQERTLARGLAEIAHRHGLDIALLPLGRASAHEDTLALNRVAYHLKDQRPLPMWSFPPAPQVVDIAALIAQAALFVGTSLHGNLTALAYRRPRVAISPRVHKLAAFLASWDPTQPDGPYPFAELASRADDAMLISAEDHDRTAQRVADAARTDARKLGTFIRRQLLGTGSSS